MRQVADMAEEVEITLHSAIAEVTPAEWDACACPEASVGRPIDPFTTHRFLTALDISGSTGKGTGWQTRPLVARQAGRVVGVVPLYVKSHSQGEYIFDHGWSEALERAGGRYYPKLQVAVPFTPATGRRFLCPDTLRPTMAQALVGLMEGNGLWRALMARCTG